MKLKILTNGYQKQTNGLQNGTPTPKVSGAAIDGCISRLLSFFTKIRPKLFYCLWPKIQPVPPRRVVVLFSCGLTFEGNNIMFLLPNDSTATVALSPTSRKGKAEAVENVSFLSSDETVVTVDATGKVSPVSNGQAVITITADAMLGDGVVMVTESIEVVVAEPLAATLNAVLLLDE